MTIIFLSYTCYTYLEACLNGCLDDEGEDHHVLMVGALLHCFLLIGLEFLLVLRAAVTVYGK